MLFMLLHSSVAAALPNTYDDPIYSVDRTNAVVYGQGKINGGAGTRDLLLDLYTPLESTDTKKPAIIIIHGGGFTSFRRDMPHFVEIAEFFTKRGFLAVSIDYRLDGDNPPADPAFTFFDSAYLPANLDAAIHAGAVDARRAVRWVRANRASLGVDGSRIVVLGSSAGAYLALMTASWDSTRFLTDLPADVPLAINNPNVSSHVAGAIDFWGGSDETKFDAADPPLMIVHGTLDATIPFTEAEDIRDAAVATGIPHEFHALVGAGHAPWGELISGETLNQTVLRFIQREIFGFPEVPVTNPAAFYFNSPAISQIPTDGSSIDLDFMFELFSGTENFVYWEIHTIGEVTIERWKPRQAVKCRNTPNLCTIESESEFLGGFDGRATGYVGRGQTGFDTANMPFKLASVRVSATGHGFVEVKQRLDGGTFAVTQNFRIAVAACPVADSDDDLVCDGLDNCAGLANSGQADSNQDGYGDACDADFSDDGIVASSDITLLSINLGCTSGCGAFDVTGDGLVASNDFTLLVLQFGGPPGPSGLSCAGTIPCP